MAPRKPSSPPSSAPMPIGNCEVIVEAKNFTCDATQNSLQISLSRNNKITISVVEEKQDSREVYEPNGDCQFVLVNPKDSDDETKTLMKEVLNMYRKELPAMSYAANTGKETKFLERCVSNGKYCTLLLISRGTEQSQEVIAALTYQIIPSDTQFAEIPLAAVSSINQRKGIGHFLYMELKKRLHSVGSRTILCWADQESEGFWIKQGFVVAGKVDTKGRARRLPIKADIRKALCFPGGSTLMISQLSKESLSCQPEQQNLSIQLRPPFSPATDLKQIAGTEDCQPKHLLKENFLADGAGFAKSKDSSSMEHTSASYKSLGGADEKQCSCQCGTKKRIWEASHTSMNSKKIRGHLVDCQLNSIESLSGSDCRKNSYWDASSIPVYEDESIGKEERGNINSLQENIKECQADDISEYHGGEEVPETRKHVRVMLMNIADDNKKSTLTKIIEDLGGAVTSDGSSSTHVISGKVRKTCNFCKALCSGAWILSPCWLKESFRTGRYVDEMPYVLRDEEYESKYKTELKDVVLRARASPNALLRGHDICIAAGIQPPVSNLSAITKSAGGNVIHGLHNIKDASKTIFVACEENMDEALSAVKKGIRTFGSDWFINCIMRQELDMEAPQFAESL